MVELAKGTRNALRLGLMLHALGDEPSAIARNVGTAGVVAVAAHMSAAPPTAPVPQPANDHTGVASAVAPEAGATAIPPAAPPLAEGRGVDEGLPRSL